MRALTAAVGPIRGVKVKRTLARRLFFRRQFYLQLARIVVRQVRCRDRRGQIFVSLMGGIGDLVNFFPTLEKLAERYVVDMGTAGYPYLALVRNNPRIRRVYTPFIYKPHREAHRRTARSTRTGAAARPPSAASSTSPSRTAGTRIGSWGCTGSGNSSTLSR